MSVQRSPNDPAAEAAAQLSGAALRPLSWRLLVRVLGIGAGIALFFILLEPFDWGMVPLARRTAQALAYGCLGGLLGLVSARLSARLGLWSNVVVAGVSTGLLMSPAMFGVVWIVTALTNGRPLPLEALPQAIWQTVLICVAMSFLAVAFSRRRVVVIAPPGPPRFLDRLPLKLRGAEVWAVEAEDHYLRLHTSKGQDLILLRLADAIDELAGIEGMQVHRSWWVARDAITEAQRGEGRATLTLKDGSQVPVSRTFAKLLRERGWI